MPRPRSRIRPLDREALERLCLVPDHQPPDVAGIARELGVHPKSLAPQRCPHFNAELRRRRAKWMPSWWYESRCDPTPATRGQRRRGRTPGSSGRQYDGPEGWKPSKKLRRELGIA